MKTCSLDVGVEPIASGHKPRVLVIDADPGIRRLLHSVLLFSEYQPVEALSVVEGCAKVNGKRPDVIFLGAETAADLEEISRLRGDYGVPIIVLSTMKDGMVAALGAGADDYVEKPFAVAEVLARMRVALRHAAEVASGETSVQIGAVCVDLERRLVTRDNVPVRVSRREYELLSYLARNIGKVLTHEQILRTIWSPVKAKSVNILREYICQLRQKLEPDPDHPRYILTEPGRGYRLWART